MKARHIIRLLLLWPLMHSLVGAATKTSEVTLSLDEFEELFSSARLQDAERRLLDQRKKHEAEHRKKLEDLQKKSEQLDADAKHQLQKLFPKNYHVLQYTASGIYNASSSSSGAERDVASFDHELIVRVMQPQWTEIALANLNSTVASGWHVSWDVEGEQEGQVGGCGIKEDAHLDEENQHLFCEVDPVTTPDVMLVLKESQQILATNRSGLFKIQFKAFSRVSKIKNRNQISMSNLLYPLSGLSLRVATSTAGDGPSSSASVKDFSIEPSAAVLQVDPMDEYTDITATIPLTDSIEIRWLDGVADEKKQPQDDTAAAGGGVETEKSRPKVDPGPQQVTAVSEALHSVGEGIIRSSFVLEFSTTGESSLNTVQFTVHSKQEGLRITLVEGHALQYWEASDVNNGTSKRVRAVFKSSHMDTTVALLVNAETRSADQSELPRVECADVLRQSGHIAVVKADANVEVHEHSTSGLTPCEPTEVSSKLRLNIDSPIVLSYKYLNPENSVVLAVKEHIAMAAQSLEAAVDRVHYKAVVTDTHTLHSAMVVMQSTKLQYLEVLRLPSTASMFTLLVNSVAAKPVKGSDGEKDGDASVLVPLLVGLNSEAANEGRSMRTSVELSYISTHDPLGRNGTLSLSPPRFNLPVSVETTHLRLPEGYDYVFSEPGFVGPEKRLKFPVPDSFSYKTGKRVVEEGYKFSFSDDLQADDEKEKKAESVSLVTPNIGTSYYFHRLVVVDSTKTLDASYSETVEETKPWWSRWTSY